MIVASQIRADPRRPRCWTTRPPPYIPATKVGLVGNGTAVSRSTFFALVPGRKLAIDNGNFSLPAGWRIAGVAQGPRRWVLRPGYVIDGDKGVPRPGANWPKPSRMTTVCW